MLGTQTWRIVKPDVSSVLAARCASVFAGRRRCLYTVLGVSREASAKEIKAAFYQLSMIHHPDKNGGSKEAHDRFQEITNAYNTLGNVTKRRQYDLERGIGQGTAAAAYTPTGTTTFRTKTWSGQPFTGRNFAQGPRRPSQAFYRVRKPFGGFPGGGKVIYDFDAWYDAHYGSKETGGGFKEKTPEERREAFARAKWRREEAARQNEKREWIYCGAGCVGFLAFAYWYVNTVL